MIRFESDGLVGICTIDRPKRRNALDVGHVDELRAVIESAAGVRAVVLSGAGSAFCAGADLDARLGDASDRAADGFRPAFEALCGALRAFPGSIIAAIDGPAFGGGAQLVAFSDLAIAGDSARIGIPAGRLGVHLSPRAIARLVDVVGVRVTEDLLLAGREYDADEAMRVGFVQYRAPNAFDAACILAAQIAEQAPLALAGHKAALNAMATVTHLEPELLTAIAAREAQAFASQDFQEGLAARAEGRKPRFTGQ